CQSSGQLTMSDIMLQKYVAMGWSMENWVDMRRFNFSAGNVGGFGVIYPGYDRTKLYAGAAALRGTSPNDVQYWIRRWRLPNALELNYNGVNAVKMNANAMETYIWGIPVWWDCTSDAEYYNFLKK
ncbi:MAG: SusD/RagB family nutrient-binding outer membrane lipoprotein, partial [Muribaculaceae bacterium]|nr:SusD/RagB family nutrient-binding outer membrane lipoprotein [Muribaculaceae bacterium]